jgi:hypothetical protein
VKAITTLSIMAMLRIPKNFCTTTDVEQSLILRIHVTAAGNSKTEKARTRGKNK